LRNFLPDQRVYERTLASACSSKRRHDDGRFESNPQRGNSLDNLPHDRTRFVSRIPGRLMVQPSTHSQHKIIDLGEDGKMFQFRSQ
jgi:hypothetical protein